MHADNKNEIFLLTTHLQIKKYLFFDTFLGSYFFCGYTAVSLNFTKVSSLKNMIKINQLYFSIRDILSKSKRFDYMKTLVDAISHPDLRYVILTNCPYLTQ